MIKLLIVDDSALMRRHLVQLFEKEGDFTVLAVRNGIGGVARRWTHSTLTSSRSTSTCRRWTA